MKLSLLSIIAVLVIVSFGLTQEAHAASFSAVQSGDWNNPTTWDLVAVPDPTVDNVEIPATITVTLTTTITNDNTIQVDGTLINNGIIINNDDGLIINNNIICGSPISGSGILSGNDVTPTCNTSTIPVITLNGDNPEIIDLGSTYTDAGATATDNSGSVPVTTSGVVDTGLVGTYMITYTASNSAGTATATRTVNVIPVGTASEVTGEGKIGKNTFIAFDVKSNGIKFNGHLAFTDKTHKIYLTSTTITMLDVNSDKTKSYFTGTAKLNHKSGYTFQVYANDNPHHTADSISITIQDSAGNTVYANTASLTNGHIEIHHHDNKGHHSDNKR